MIRRAVSVVVSALAAVALTAAPAGASSCVELLQWKECV